MAVPPPEGASRNWDPNTRLVAEEIESNFDVRCSTYPGHGRTGQPWGIDAWVAPFRSRANRVQEQLGDRIQHYVERNWNRLGIDYMIWWNWMIENKPNPALLNRGWFSYEPYAFKWPGGDLDPQTRRHFDHVHLQITVGHDSRPPATRALRDNPEKNDSDKAQIIDRYFRAKDYYPHIPYEPIGELLVSECRRMGEGGLWVSTAAALVEQESGGKNIFGCDWTAKWTRVPPYCNVAVTEERVKALLRNIDEGGGANGVGLTQLTYPPYVREAEAMGGGHILRYQMRVGFKLLNDLLAQYDYLNALEAYNDGNGRWNDPENPYDLQFAAKHRAWKDRLNG
jgi:hypothetical protein